MRRINVLIATLGLAVLALACNSAFETDLGFEKTTQFIVNGVPDHAAAHKAVVGLYTLKPKNDCKASQGIFCTGTLIHPQYVLTAAHCIVESDGFGNHTENFCMPFIRVGIGNNANEVASHLYDIQATYYPIEYKGFSINLEVETTDSDIALIKLKKRIPASLATPILTLPPWLALSTQNLGQDGRDMEFSGFGYDENGDSGQKLKFTNKASHYCGRSNPDDEKPGCSMDAVKIDGCHPNRDLCEIYGPVFNKIEDVYAPYGSFYYPQIAGGPCQGDSGGPGFVTIGGIEYVASVTSYGDEICSTYGISTASQDFYDWMLEQAPELADNYVEICDNNIDDDGNKLVDCEDPACKNTLKCGGSGKDDDENDLKNKAHSAACSSTTKTPTSTPFKLVLLALLAFLVFLTRPYTRTFKPQS